MNNLEQLRLLNARFTDSAAAAFRALEPWVRAAGEAIRSFGDALYAAACTAYLERHRRLPGSDRTARLKKKRRVIVMRWFLAQMAGVERLEGR